MVHIACPKIANSAPTAHIITPTRTSVEVDFEDLFAQNSFHISPSLFIKSCFESRG
jgi:hypothetical protein